MLRGLRRWKSKLVSSADEAVARIQPGSTVFSGGFGLVGVPFSLLKAVGRNPAIRDLTIISNTAGTEHHGLSLLLQTGQARKMVCSYVGENKLFERKYLEGSLEVELVPQGTLAEGIRCGGMGIDVFSTPTGVGTLVEKGGFVQKYSSVGVVERHSQPKPTVVSPLTGRKLLLETALKGDVALVKARKADESGNLVFNKSAFNFNGDIARAAKYVIAEVEELVPNGSLDPNQVHVPGLFVDALVLTEETEKPLEKIVNTTTLRLARQRNSDKDRKRMRIAQRAARDIFSGAALNLGIGIPTLIPFFVAEGVELNIHAENGIMGVGGYPREGEEDPDLINPGKETITVLNSASFFSSSDSFGIVRGGHLDFTYLGAMEVDQLGNLANWVIPGKFLKGMGGAMDLVACGSQVTVLTEHTSKHNASKIKKQCELPLTGENCVSKIITELAVFTVLPEQGGLLLTELAEDTTLGHVIDNTECEFAVSPNLLRF